MMKGIRTAVLATATLLSLKAACAQTNYYDVTVGSGTQMG